MSEERKSRYELFLEDEARKAQPTKRCSKCGETKALGEFHKQADSKTGVASRCRKCRKKGVYKSSEDRFWKLFWPRTAKVNGCLLWTGACKNGYPVCSYKGNRNTLVRRLVYRLACGDLSGDLVVLATCNNKRCVLQSHMKAASHEELHVKRSNNALYGDIHPARSAPGYLARGEQNGGSKLTDNIVQQMRKLHNSGMPQKEIARSLHVSPQLVNLVVHRKTWKHVE